jgi:uncharacterized membrane protein
MQGAFDSARIARTQTAHGNAPARIHERAAPVVLARAGLLVRKWASRRFREYLMNLAHVHILLNHFPTVGMIVALGLYVVALIWKSHDVTRASLAVLVGISATAIATFITGSAAAEPVATLPGVSKAAILAHQDAALVAFAVMQLTGIAAWLGLWQYRRIARISGGILAAVLILGLVTLGLMTDAANLGGEIRHQEILSKAEMDARGGAGPARGWVNSTAIGEFVTGKPWMWPTCETLHFVGLSLLLGVVLVVDLRMLGVMKNVSFATLHRLLPWGILGFGINLMTGMLFFLGAPDQYTRNTAFQWKIAMVLVAAANALYFTVLDEAWVLGPGDEAPLTAKVMAASAMFLWVGVMYCGSMLPFLGNSF